MTSSTPVISNPTPFYSTRTGGLSADHNGTSSVTAATTTLRTTVNKDVPLDLVLGLSIATVVLVLVGAAIFFRFRKKHFPRTHYRRRCKCAREYAVKCARQPQQLYSSCFVNTNCQCTHELCLQLEDALSESSNTSQLQDQQHTDGTETIVKPIKSILKKPKSNQNLQQSMATKQSNTSPDVSNPPGTCSRHIVSRGSNMAANQCSVQCGNKIQTVDIGCRSDTECECHCRKFECLEGTIVKEKIEKNVFTLTDVGNVDKKQQL